VRTILTPHQTDPSHPFIDEPGVLTGAEMPIMIDPVIRRLGLHWHTNLDYFQPPNYNENGLQS